MVFVDTILCTTSGYVSKDTAVALRNPMTGQTASLPAGASIREVVIYRDGDVTVTPGCTIQLGVVGATNKYIASGDALTTTHLNSGRTIYKTITSDIGLAAAAELRVILSGSLSTGAISFEITYQTYS